MMRNSGYVAGTAAYEIREGRSRTFRVIRPVEKKSPISDFIRRTFERSEMLCSLVFEDVRGCAYSVFSRFEVIAASVIITALAALAIALAS